MFKYILIFLAFCIGSLFSQIAPRGWQDHISINVPNSVAKSGSTIYASNRAGIIYFNEEELSPQTLNKINGLSDVGIRLLRSNTYNKKTLVIYDNSNIDIIDENNNVKNYPDFKLKTLAGKKIVNEVTFDKQLAYLACGFGIVVFDTEKLEVRDTYIIGPSASEVDIFQVALNDSLIFAATPLGIFSSNYKTQILNNYQNWKLDTVNLPKGIYPGIVNVKGTILTAWAPSRLSDTIKGKDTLYSLSAQNVWQKYPPFNQSNNTIIKLGPTYVDPIQGYFSIVDATSLLVLEVSTGSIVTHLNSFNGEVGYGEIRDAVMGKDHTGNVSYWVADNRFGLYQTLGVFPYFPQNKFTRNGTNKSSIGNIDIFDGVVAVSPSLIENAGVGNYIREGINILKDGEWKYLPTSDPNGVALEDVTSVLLDRKDKTKMWVASWANGVFEYKDNVQIAAYTSSNTNIPMLGGVPRSSGLSMDDDGNVWFTHSDQKGFLGVIHKDGRYQNLEFDGGRFSRKTYIDSKGNIWILHERNGGITIYKPELINDVFATPIKDVNYQIMNSAIGTGNLESNSVYTIAEDKDGRMWIGTNAGIKVLYNTNALFDGGNYDAQPIKIVQDGNVELLLGKETVTSIVIDGANNKWCGTSLGGVYCFSPDGITQLYHFTKENSPLYSNTIIDINYDEVTGDIFIGTETGLQSFRSTIIEGSQTYSNVYAYPNPVKPDYQGSVFVRGLLNNSVVKIADESGALVWETKSTGGQIEWPVRTLSGTKVSTGVYLIYSATPNGTFRVVSKVLVVN